MCKVLMFTNGFQITKLKKLVNAVMPIITERDRDGFGWAAQGAKGVFGERMTEYTNGYRLDSNSLAVKLPVKETYNSFGTRSKLVGGLLFHGRVSTNQKTLQNTHPIQRNGWTLIHNGVVTNQGPEYKQNTTNDTEHVVHYLSTTGISGIEKNLTGYYAVGALDPKGLLHVFRDSIAPLYTAWIPDVATYAIATTAALIDDVCAEMEWTPGPIEPLVDNIYFVFKGNDVVEQRTIAPLGYSKRESDWFSTSMHHVDGTIEAASADLPTTGSDSLREADLKKTAYELFFDEVAEMDDDYEIMDEHWKPITLDQFLKMDQVTQLMCYIQRPDGTDMSPEAIEMELRSA
jgi:hypothetical protein